ncbi:receptor-type tyrosine-protein phosphatase delta-like, partial [Lingula anatina]|uniref:Receptor-type tyrosine-protein phosphatase delta-like n=1 Tax=Lingula anatina TaxID=7574 RepID=A0A1S3JGF1_LINAN
MWTPPPNETCLIDYVVEMTESDGQNSVKELIKGYQSTEKNITGLKKYWSYDIKVKANTTAGPSMPSPLITKRTLEDTPGPPARVNASCDVCYNNMTVTWEAPTRENKNGIITGYVLYYISTDGKISKNKEISGSQNSSTITSLSAEKSYQVKVAARTSVGEGENKTAPTNVKLTSGPPIFVALANTFAKVSTASVEDARKQISLQVPSSPFGSENGIVRNISVIVAEDSEA